MFSLGAVMLYLAFSGKKCVFLWYLLITCTITIPPIIFKLYSNYIVNWCRNVIHNGNSFLMLSASPFFVKFNPVVFGDFIFVVINLSYQTEWTLKDYF